MLPFCAHCRLSIQQAKPALVCHIIWQYNKADWARANDMLSSYHLVEGVDVNHAWITSIHSL